MRIKYGMCKVGYKTTYFNYGSISTGLNENDILKDQISIYPNPVADGNLTIDLTQFEVKEPLLITVTDVQGRVIYKQLEKLNSKVEVDTRSISGGLYFVNVSSENFKANYKFIKQ